MLDFIAEAARARPRKINVIIDRKGITDTGINLDEPMNVNVKDISISKALKMVLGEHILSYVIQDDGTVLVSSKTKINADLPVKTYQIADLLGDGDRGNRCEAAERLRQHILQFVHSTEPWEEAGGRSRIAFLPPGSMTVAHTADGHAKVATLLQDLRRGRSHTDKRAAPAGHADAISVRDSPLMILAKQAAQRDLDNLRISYPGSITGQKSLDQAERLAAEGHIPVAAVGEATPPATGKGAPAIPTVQPDGTGGSSWQSIAQVEEQIKKLAPTNYSILLLGETGTGKEFYAKKILQASDRKDKPFVVINCPSLPKERIDSALFGHVKGAFTGAVQDYSGQIRPAEGGTVFLDEIGDLPQDCWANVLRFLQDKEINPLNGKTSTVDVRILAATSKQTKIPSEAIHRFEHVLRLPPLRARRGDIPALAKDFFASAKPRTERITLRFTEDEIDKLATSAFNWPGNIRQLEKAILRAVVLHESGRDLTADEVLRAAKSITD